MYHDAPEPRISASQGLDPALRRLDERLRDAARPAPAPDGLARRCVEASVGLLPSSGPRLRLTSATPRRTRPTTVIVVRQRVRLALAASLVAAFILAATWLVPGPGAPIAPGREMVGRPHVPTAQPAPDAGAEIDREYALALMESFERDATDVEAILSGAGAGFDDIVAEIAALTSDLEM